MLSKRDASDVAAQLVARWPDRTRKDKIHRYVKGEHDLPFAPRASKAHYLWTLRKSRTNWCRLLVQLLAQNLFVDGIRATGQTEGDAGPWRFWTANRMARRQSAVHRAALKYGHAFVSALPGEPGPVIRGHSPRDMTAFYADEADEWPVYAIERAKSWTPSGPRTLYRLYDETSVYFLGAEGDGSLSYVEHRDHNAGVVPIVRFVDEDDLDSTPRRSRTRHRHSGPAQLLHVPAPHGGRTRRPPATLGRRVGAGRGRGTPDRPGPAVALRQPRTRFGSFDATR